MNRDATTGAGGLYRRSGMSRSTRSAAALIGALALAGAITAQATTWTGGGGSDHSWYTPANWNAGVPSAGVQAWMNPGTSVVASNAAQCSIVVVGSGGQHTLQLTGGSLDVGGTAYIGESVGGDGSLLQNGGTTLSAVSLYVGYNSYNATTVRGSYTMTNASLTVGTDMTIGHTAVATGTVFITDGTTIVSNNLSTGAAGNGSMVIHGGTVNVGNTLYVGQYSTGSGSMRIEDATVNVTNYLYAPGAGYGSVTQAGGQVSVGELRVAYNASTTGSYTLADGVLLDRRTNGWTYVGAFGNTRGTFTQLGGTNLILGTNPDDRSLSIGNDAGAQSAYNLYGGALMLSNAYLYLGRFGSGEFNLGNSNGTGQIVTKGTCRIAIGSSSTLRGWGTISNVASFTIGGRILADGFATDRTLDLSAVTLGAKSEVITYTSTNGLFAQNHGAVSLPAIAFSAASTQCWGDTATTLTQLVNSVKFVPTGGGGTLTGALLATDHGNANRGLTKPIAVWDFSGPTFSTCALTIRYDDLKAASLGIAESDLKVAQYVNGAWKNITGAVTTGAKTITANAVSPLSQIAIAAAIIPRGTIISLR